MLVHGRAGAERARDRTAVRRRAAIARPLGPRGRQGGACLPGQGARRAPVAGKVSARLHSLSSPVGQCSLPGVPAVSLGVHDAAGGDVAGGTAAAEAKRAAGAQRAALRQPGLAARQLDHAAPAAALRRDLRHPQGGGGHGVDVDNPRRGRTRSPTVFSASISLSLLLCVLFSPTPTQRSVLLVPV